MPDPQAVNTNSWLMYKLGRPVSPLDVVHNGSHSLHAVGDEGIAVQTTSGMSLRIRWAGFCCFVGAAVAVARAMR